MANVSLTVELGDRSYPIHIAAGALKRLGSAMSAEGLSGRTLVITHAPIRELYGEVVEASLRAAGFTPSFAETPCGDGAKTLRQAEALYDACVEAGLDRSSTIVTLGGGVVGDLGGFIAATYMRGIQFVQAPTSLLAQVDASVGGKVAVNHSAGKNLIGAFLQPAAVVCDLDVLRTLPRDEYLSGLSEVVKHGVIRDADLFAFIEDHVDAILQLDPQCCDRLVRRSCEIKAAVVAADERESGLRRILNYGHTVGHALEAVSEYEGLRHGEAVAIGMMAAGRLALALGWVDEGFLQRQGDVLARLGLPVALPGVDVEAVLAAMMRDKKAEAGRLRWVLPRAIGSVEVTEEPTPEQVRAAVESVVR